MLMHRIKLENLLSFGPYAEELELKPLNVLIGPNGSGKSNLIEAISLLKAAPDDIMAPIREGGGEYNWVWSRDPYSGETRVDVVLENKLDPSMLPLRYSVAFEPFLETTDLREEIEDFDPTDHGTGRAERYLDRQPGRITLTHVNENGKRAVRNLDPVHIRSDQSILSQVRDPSQYPQLTFVSNMLAQIHRYRNWDFGRNSSQTAPQKAELPRHTLLEDGRNLGMVLDRLESISKARFQLLTALQKLNSDIDDFHVHVDAGSFQIVLEESGVQIPASRLSDGTLRYLCLLAILCDPAPPPLVCIEEPELGLHPDVLPGLADLFREASERCQLIVTTHSDTFVDSLTETPESIVICEKEEWQTRFRRLERKDVSHLLGKYRLGELWTSGKLGGNRW